MNAFPRKHRLLNSHEFSAVFRTGKKIVCHSFVIYSQVNTLGYSRLGLAIGKKFIRTAVGRNRIKRTIRESFRLTSHPSNNDIVVVARSKILAMTTTQLRKQLSAQWERLN